MINYKKTNMIKIKDFKNNNLIFIIKILIKN